MNQTTKILLVLGVGSGVMIGAQMRMLDERAAMAILLGLTLLVRFVLLR